MKWVLALAAIVFLLGNRRASGGDPPILIPGTFDPLTPLEVWRPMLADTPTPGAGYRLRQGDVLFGNNGVIARALRSAGRAATPAERVAYYAAIGRVRSNWRLYGTLASAATPAVERFTVRNADGSTVQGTITAALLPRHDAWEAALNQAQLPARLIGWNRSAAGSVSYLPDAAQRAHAQVRTFGVLRLPPVSAIDLGQDVTYDPAMDWPAELYTATDTTWQGAFA